MSAVDAVRTRTVSRSRQRAGLSITGVLLRGLLGVLGLSVLLLPMYRHTGPAIVVLLICIVPLLTAVYRPDGPWVGFVMAGSLLDWLIGSLLSGSYTPVLVLTYALVLFWLHRVAALAAVLPWGVELDAVAAKRFLLRTGGISLLSLPLMLGLLLIRSSSQGSFPLALVGALAALGILFAVVLLLHRQRRM